MKLFDMDSPVMRFMTLVANLMILNILALICCIPIITAGASLTAMHYMALKLVRDEEGSLVKGFFHSFKENFKQSTILWVIMVLTYMLIGFDLLASFYKWVDLPTVVEVIVLVMGIVVILTSLYIFPLQSKFANPIRVTIKNSLMIALMQTWRTVLMAIFNLIPLAFLLMPRLFPLLFLFSISLPAYLSALLYNKLFRTIEEKIVEKNGDTEQTETEESEDEKIFHDYVDEEIADNQKK